MLLSSEGSPIHPGCIYELVTGIADTLPIRASIDIEGCNGSNAYYKDFEVNDDGEVKYRPEGEATGYIGYSVEGFVNDFYIVLFWDNLGGGTLTSVVYLLLKESHDTYFQINPDDTLNERKRHILTVYAQLLAGWRDNAHPDPMARLTELAGRL